MTRRVALIANANAGRGTFEAVCDKLIHLLESRGIDVFVKRTTAEPYSAQRLAAEATCSCDLVIACGGDGTVHGVLQGLVGTSTHFGVLPFGTANALARHLQLSMDPVKALEKLLTFQAREMPVGRVETSTGSQWFLVMTGAGPDGRLIYEMSRNRKVYLGRYAYYAEAARHFLTRRFPPFRVEYRSLGSNMWKSQSVSAMMVSRISNLGGLFKGLTTTSRLHHPYLLVKLVAAPAHIALPAWFILGRLGFTVGIPGLTNVKVEELRCFPIEFQTDIYAQVDGEAAGTLPMKVSITSSNVLLLMEHKRRR